MTHINPRIQKEHETHTTITLNGGTQRAYAKFVLTENGFSEEAADALLAGSSTGTESAYITQAELADQLKCSTRHVRELAKRGELVPAYRDGKRPFYKHDAAANYQHGLSQAQQRQAIAHARIIAGN